MSQKTKSALYFIAFVVTLITYYQMDNVKTIQKNEIANNTIKQVSEQGTLN